MRSVLRFNTMRIMQFSCVALWTVSSAPLGLKGMAMESGTKAADDGESEKQLKFIEEFPAARIPVLVHTALFLGLANIT